MQASKKFIYIDESGDLGKYGTNYFVIAAIEVEYPHDLSRIIKRVRLRKLKKKLKKISEIKASFSTPEIRRFILTKITEIKECKIWILAVQKQKILPEFMQKQNELYNWLVRVLCRNLESERIHIIIDRKYSNRLLRREFDDYLKKEFAKREIGALIEHRESHATPELQAVDFVAWAINRKYSHGDDSYYRIIKDKITNQSSEELWKEKENVAP